jgi:hypothetical protein
MSRKWRYVNYIYLIGALATEATMMVGAYQNGAFQREHAPRDLAIVALMHLAVAALWPVLIGTLALMYLGILPPTFHISL